MTADLTLFITLLPTQRVHPIIIMHVVVSGSALARRGLCSNKSLRTDDAFGVGASLCTDSLPLHASGT